MAEQILSAWGLGMLLRPQLRPSPDAEAVAAVVAAAVADAAEAGGDAAAAAAVGEAVAAAAGCGGPLSAPSSCSCRAQTDSKGLGQCEIMFAPTIGTRLPTRSSLVECNSRPETYYD